MLKRLTLSHAGAASRIKAWAAARFGEGEEAWLVSEDPCLNPDGPGRTTTLALVHPVAQIVFRIPVPMAEVTPGDVNALGEVAARLAAEACC
jgi:hypothetical protein